MKRDYVALIAIITLIINAIAVYFGRIYFPEAFRPDKVGFFENYWVLTLELCIVIAIVIYAIAVLWWVTINLSRDIRSLFR